MPYVISPFFLHSFFSPVCLKLTGIDHQTEFFSEGNYRKLISVPLVLRFIIHIASNIVPTLQWSAVVLTPMLILGQCVPQILLKRNFSLSSIPWAGHLQMQLTPRRIILDTAFMTGLQNVIRWTGNQDPSLSDLHPSLGNGDHAARLINKLQFERFPDGTGFEGHLFLHHRSTGLY